MHKISLLLTIVLLGASKNTQAQRIFNEMSKYDFRLIEKKTIKNTPKQLGISKEEGLFSLLIFDAKLIHPFDKQKVSNWEFINNLEVVNPKIYAKVLVYNDSLNSIALTFVSTRRVAPLYKSYQQTFNMVLQFYMEEKPEYFFWLFSHKIQIVGYCFISYKEGKTKIIYQDRNDSVLTIKEVKDIEDIRPLNPFTLHD